MCALETHTSHHHCPSLPKWGIAPHLYHVEKNSIVPNHSFHQSCICNSPLVQNINTTHVGVIEIYNTWSSKSLFGQCPFTFTDRCTILELFAILGMVDNTLTGSLSCQVTHVKLPLCLQRALPFLRNLTFFVLESQISFGKSTLLDLTVPQTRVFLSCNSSNSATDV